MKQVCGVVLLSLLGCQTTPDAAPRPFFPKFDGASFDRVNDQGVALYRRRADDAVMIFVPGGNFFMNGKEWYLPPYLIDEDPISDRELQPIFAISASEAHAYAKKVGAQVASAAHLQKAGMPGLCIEQYRNPKSAWIEKDGPGFRCVIEQPLLPSYTIEWRRSWWEALEESRRRNAIIFLTMHWDG
jgi:hypothetical protein